MEQDRKKIVLTAVSLIVQEFEFSSSESDDEELQLIGRNPRRTVQRIENYVEELIPTLIKKEFKTHFRYTLLMFKISKKKLKKYIYVMCI